MQVSPTEKTGLLSPARTNPDAPIDPSVFIFRKLHDRSFASLTSRVNNDATTPILGTARTSPVTERAVEEAARCFYAYFLSGVATPQPAATFPPNCYHPSGKNSPDDFTKTNTEKGILHQHNNIHGSANLNFVAAASDKVAITDSSISTGCCTQAPFVEAPTVVCTSANSPSTTKIADDSPPPAPLSHCQCCDFWRAVLTEIGRRQHTGSANTSANANGGGTLATTERASAPHVCATSAEFIISSPSSADGDGDADADGHAETVGMIEESRQRQSGGRVPCNEDEDIEANSSSFSSPLAFPQRRNQQHQRRRRDENHNHQKAVPQPVQSSDKGSLRKTGNPLIQMATDSTGEESGGIGISPTTGEGNIVNIDSANHSRGGGGGSNSSHTGKYHSSASFLGLASSSSAINSRGGDPPQPHGSPLLPVSLLGMPSIVTLSSVSGLPPPPQGVGEQREQPQCDCHNAELSLDGTDAQNIPPPLSCLCLNSESASSCPRTVSLPFPLPPLQPPTILSTTVPAVVNNTPCLESSKNIPAVKGDTKLAPYASGNNNKTTAAAITQPTNNNATAAQEAFHFFRESSPATSAVPTIRPEATATSCGAIVTATSDATPAVRVAHLAGPGRKDAFAPSPPAPFLMGRTDPEEGPTSMPVPNLHPPGTATPADRPSPSPSLHPPPPPPPEWGIHNNLSSFTTPSGAAAILAVGLNATQAPLPTNDDAFFLNRSGHHNSVSHFVASTRVVRRAVYNGGLGNVDDPGQLDDFFETLNEYILLEEVGRGQYGRVVMAVHEDDADKRFVVKIIPKSKLLKKYCNREEDDNDGDSVQSHITGAHTPRATTPRRKREERKKKRKARHGAATQGYYASVHIVPSSSCLSSPMSPSLSGVPTAHDTTTTDSSTATASTTPTTTTPTSSACPSRSVTEPSTPRAGAAGANQSNHATDGQHMIHIVPSRTRTRASAKPSPTAQSLRSLTPNQRQKPVSDALEREIAVMKKLRHRNIVHLVEVIDDPEDNHLYLVMPYIERGPVLKIENGRCAALEIDVVRAYMKQLLSAVAYLHRNQVVHCDIKPDNVLLGADGRIYLTDFGVCEIFSSSHESDGSDAKHTIPDDFAPESIRRSVFRDFDMARSQAVSYESAAVDPLSEAAASGYRMPFNEVITTRRRRTSPAGRISRTPSNGLSQGEEPNHHHALVTSVAAADNGVSQSVVSFEASPQGRLEVATKRLTSIPAGPSHTALSCALREKQVPSSFMSSMRSGEHRHRNPQSSLTRATTGFPSSELCSLHSDSAFLMGMIMPPAGGVPAAYSDPSSSKRAGAPSPTQPQPQQRLPFMAAMSSKISTEQRHGTTTSSNHTHTRAVFVNDASASFEVSATQSMLGGLDARALHSKHPSSAVLGPQSQDYPPPPAPSMPIRDHNPTRGKEDTSSSAMFPPFCDDETIQSASAPTTRMGEDPLTTSALCVNDFKKNPSPRNKSVAMSGFAADLHNTKCTPAFAAPETMTGSVFNGAKADVWSVGVTMFVMLFGRLPFAGDTVYGVFRAISLGEVSYHVSVSAEAAAFVRRASEGTNDSDDENEFNDGVEAEADAGCALLAAVHSLRLLCAAEDESNEGDSDEPGSPTAAKRRPTTLEVPQHTLQAMGYDDRHGLVTKYRHALGLLQRLLARDPAERSSARRACEHAFFGQSTFQRLRGLRTKNSVALSDANEIEVSM